MRKNLERINKKRSIFQGRFERFGSKSSWHGNPKRTVLLLDIRDGNDRIISDHLWFNYTKGFQALGHIAREDIIEFHARVTEYVKGYVNHRDFIDNREIDYRLSYPTKFKLVKNKSKNEE